MPVRIWIWPEPLVAPRVRRALGTRVGERYTWCKAHLIVSTCKFALYINIHFLPGSCWDDVRRQVTAITRILVNAFLRKFSNGWQLRSRLSTRSLGIPVEIRSDLNTSYVLWNAVSMLKSKCQKLSANQAAKNSGRSVSAEGPRDGPLDILGGKVFLARFFIRSFVELLNLLYMHYFGICPPPPPPQGYVMSTYSHFTHRCSTQYCA
jgi:hypothetical protein